MQDLYINKWAAWSSQLSSNEEWEAWAKNPFDLMPSDTVPKVDHIPAISRRRLGFLTKIVLDLGKRLELTESKPPIILFSKYGEIIQQFKITDNLIENNEISPSAFSSSVFNTSVGQLSIFESITAPYSALFSDENNLALAFFDAVSKIEEGAPEVAIIFAEESIPHAYVPDLARQNVAIGFGLCLSRTKPEDCARKFSIVRSDQADSDLKSDYVSSLISCFINRVDIINNGYVLGFGHA